MKDYTLVRQTFMSLHVYYKLKASALNTLLNVSVTQFVSDLHLLRIPLVKQFYTANDVVINHRKCVKLKVKGKVFKNMPGLKPDGIYDCDR